MLRIAVAVSALALMASAAQAEPVRLSDASMDEITAGFGVNGAGQPNGSPFELEHHNTADNGIAKKAVDNAVANGVPSIPGFDCNICGVGVPSIVPGSG